MNISWQFQGVTPLEYYLRYPMSQTAKAALKEAGPSRHDTEALGRPSAVPSQLDDLDDATLRVVGYKR